MTEYVSVSFEAEIRLNVEDIDDAGGDVAQAVQNAIGFTGAAVRSADSDYVGDGDDDADELSYEHLDPETPSTAGRFFGHDDEDDPR